MCGSMRFDLIMLASFAPFWSNPLAVSGASDRTNTSNRGKGFSPRARAQDRSAGNNYAINQNARTRGKGDVLVTYDNRSVIDNPFVFQSFMWNNVLQARGAFDKYVHFNGHDCYMRKDTLLRKGHSTLFDPHWCRIFAVWKLLDEGYARVLYIDSDLLLEPGFTFDKFIREAEAITDYMPFQDKKRVALTPSCFYGICIKMGGLIHLTSGFLLFKNQARSYQILKQWLATYPSLPPEKTKTDQGPLQEVLRAHPSLADATVLTCSRAQWRHSFNGLGNDLRTYDMRQHIADFLSKSLSSHLLQSPYAHLVAKQQGLKDLGVKDWL